VTATPVARSELSLPLAVTSLMKGVVYADTHPKAWRHLLQLQPAVRDYVATMGLTVVVDEAEGYAFLRQRTDDEAGGDRAGGDGAGQAGDGIPRLVPRRALSFHVSLLLALLRKRLAEFDSTDSGTACILTRQQLVDLVEVFLPQQSNEARMVDQIDTLIAKVVDLGFLRKVRDADASYEVRRILKAFVDAQWLAGLDAGLRRYAVQVGALPDDGVPDEVASDEGVHDNGVPDDGAHNGGVHGDSGNG
jgi:hypothetical protein